MKIEYAEEIWGENDVTFVINGHTISKHKIPEMLDAARTIIAARDQRIADLESKLECLTIWYEAPWESGKPGEAAGKIIQAQQRIAELEKQHADDAEKLRVLADYCVGAYDNAIKEYDEPTCGTCRFVNNDAGDEPCQLCPGTDGYELHPAIEQARAALKGGE